MGIGQIWARDRAIGYSPLVLSRESASDTYTHTPSLPRGLTIRLIGDVRILYCEIDEGMKPALQTVILTTGFTPEISNTDKNCIEVMVDNLEK